MAVSGGGQYEGSQLQGGCDSHQHRALVALAVQSTTSYVAVVAGRDGRQVEDMARVDSADSHTPAPCTGRGYLLVERLRVSIASAITEVPTAASSKSMEGSADVRRVTVSAFSTKECFRDVYPRASSPPPQRWKSYSVSPEYSLQIQ